MTSTQSPKRIPTLDGWRGVAILFVLIAHAQSGLLRGHPYGNYPWMVLGLHGVTIFFVLSGFLITTRLLREERIDLAGFYIRRIFRLWPSAWAYLLFVALLAVTARVNIIGDDAGACLLLFRNFYPAHESSRNALTSHFWSLSVEEQFYLVWPALLAVSSRRVAKALVCLALMASLGTQIWFWRTLTEPTFPAQLSMQFQGILVGCLMGLLLTDPERQKFVSRFSRPLFVVSGVTFVAHVATYHGYIYPTEVLAIAGLLAATCMNPSMAVSKLLEWKRLQFVGVISYSLYIWQELFLIPHTKGIGIVILPAAAVLSWAFIEKPGIRLGHMLAERRKRPKNQRSTRPALLDSDASA